MGNPPKISVVIPTCDRPQALAEGLALLRDQAGALGAETIVSNDGSEPLTDVARQFPWARFVQGPRRGPAANRNEGARHATGDWIVFLDDDCQPQAGCLEAYRAAAAKDAHDLLEGRVDAIGWTAHPLDERVENTRGGVFWSCNLAVRRSLFERSGGFDEDFRQAAFEDMELAARLRGLGARTAFVENARVLHPVRRLTLAQLWRRTLMTRWYALYLRKTMPRSGPGAIARLLVANLGRGLGRRAREFSIAHWPRDLFLALWEIATFPVLLPYVCYWDAKFGSRTR